MANFDLSKAVNRAVKRVKPVFNRIQARAQVRQEAWLRLRRHELETFRRRLKTLTNGTSNRLSEWIEIPGLIQKTSIEVRPKGTGWQIVERGVGLNPLKIYRKKQQAVTIGRRLAKTRHTDLRVYTRNNSVQQRVTYTH